MYKHVALASLIINVFTLTMPLFIMNVYDRIVPNAAFESLWVLTIGVVIILIFDFLLRNTRAYFLDDAGRNADVLLLGTFMDVLLDVKLDEKPVSSIGGVLAKMREWEYAREFFGSTTLIAVLDLPFILMFLSIIFMIGGWIVLIPLICILIMIIYHLIAQKFFEKATQEQLYYTTKKNALLGEVAAGYETIRATRLEKSLIKKWDLHTDKAAAANKKAKLLGVFTANGNMLTNNLLSVLIVVSGVYQVDAGTMSMGGLIACVLLLGRCMAPINGIVSMLSNLYKARIGLKSIQNLLSLPSENPSKLNHLLNDETASFDDIQIVEKRAIPVDIRLENISFYYPQDSSTALAIKDLSLTIKKGDKLGIIGQTGSGKSTLSRIIAGLYTPSEGHCFYGSTEISNSPLAAIRKNMGILPQPVILFGGTIRSNIIDAWPDDVAFSESALIEIAKISGVMDFAQKHPLGLDMPIEEHGVGLSGGQMQAVGLARALVGNPQTLILDEPSSHLDAQSEALLIQRLSTYLQDKTLILLTHRNAMLQLVDKLIVMQDGRIVKEARVEKVIKGAVSQLSGDAV